MHGSVARAPRRKPRTEAGAARREVQAGAAAGKALKATAARPGALLSRPARAAGALATRTPAYIRLSISAHLGQLQASSGQHVPSAHLARASHLLVSKVGHDAGTCVTLAALAAPQLALHG